MRPGHRRRRRSPIMLVLLCAALAALVYWEIDGNRPPDGGGAIEVAARPDPRPLPPEPEFAMPPLDSYAEIVARPLFSPSRRPPPAAEGDAEDDASEAKPALFILTGVVISAEARLALIQRANIAGVVRVSEGEEIDGWLVEKIAPDRVTLRQGAAVEEIELPDKIERIPAQRRLRTRKAEPAGAEKPAGEDTPGDEDETRR